MSNQIIPLAMRRHSGGAPLLSPTALWWEDGVTLNAAVTYLPQTESNHALITQLLAGTVYYNEASRDGLIAVHYRARPKSDPGFLMTRSFIGMALFTPQLDLLYRYPEPVMSPDQSKTGPDYLGVEDPRITRIGDKFVMVYCGSAQDAAGAWCGALCTAESNDLLLWTKCGPIDLQFPRIGVLGKFDDTYFDNMKGVTGTNQQINNKDGVFFSEPIDGWHYLLHRPMLGKLSEWTVHLARTQSLNGQWTDLGPVARAKPRAGFEDAWLGAGTVPIDLGAGRYLEICHSGYRAQDGSRLYTLGALLLNLNRLDPTRPSSIVEARVDDFMVPQTRWEMEGPYPDSVGNVLFTCGAFERNGDICILYGGGDTCVMAATIAKAELLNALVPVENL